jgi:putative transposase
MMPNYRRSIVPGGTFFFTLVSWQRRPVLCNPDIRASLREAITTVRAIHPFAVVAMVLLPDHLHCVWELPAGDSDFAVRWAMIKRFVTKRIAGSGNGAHSAPYGSASRMRRHEGCLWQRRFWEHQVRDQPDLTRCLDYLHWNPVKDGYVRAVIDWPFSSFHRYVKQGYYPSGWGGPGVIDGGGGEFGE